MNVTYEAGAVVIRIPCSPEQAKSAPVSRTGKSRMISNSGGFIAVQGAPDGVKLSLNLIGKL